MSMINKTDLLFILIISLVLLMIPVSSQCHFSCNTCTTANSDVSCSDCGPATNRQLISTSCVCKVGYSDDYTNAACVALTCDDSCLTCQQDATNCITCDANNHRTLIGAACPCQEGYYDDGVALCADCPTTCQGCTSDTVCTVCDSANLHRELSGNDCVCEAGYFQDGVDTCATCSYKCATCSTSSTNCDTCVTNANSQRGAAPDCDCPAERFFDLAEEADCQSCDYTCLTCTDTTGCDSCSAAVDFRSMSQSTGFCVCLPRYYDVGSTTICSACDATCLTCNGAANTDCLTCNGVSKRTYDTSTSKCVCMSGYYETSASVELCSACHVTCLTCSGGNTDTDCIACDSTKNRITNGAASCICKDGYYSDTNLICKLCHSSCETCSSYSVCTACISTQLTTLASGKCQCTSTQYWDSANSICVDCHYSCGSCITSTTKCQSCPASSNRIYSLTAFTCKCKPKYYDNSVATCVACSSPLCLTCNSGGDCLTCDSSKYRKLDATNCICKDGYYEVDSSTELCEVCHYSCETCSDGISCDTCGEFSFRAIVSDFCQCIQGYYEDPDTLLCQPCLYNCQDCENAISCSLCNNVDNHRTLDADLGLCICDDGFYDNQVDELCLTCLTYCKTCIDGTQCTTCQSTDFRILSATTKRCVCMDKYFDNAVAMCVGCHYSCKTCSQSADTNCLTCNATANRYKSGNSCLCKAGFYDDTSNQECVPCQYSCLTCSDGVSCDTCDNGRTPSTFCDCPTDRFYDDGNTDICYSCQYSCLTCTDSDSCDTCDAANHREADPEGGPFCTCMDTFYDDGLDNQLCKACNFACLTCINSTTCETCDTANHYRSLPAQMCPCITRYYSITDQAICQPCQYTCKTCVAANKCKTCDANMFRKYKFSTQLCICMDKYYDDGGNHELCVSCDYSCKTCSTDSINCLTCNSTANRVLDGTSCACKPYFYDDLQNQECLSCHYSCATCSESISCDTCNSVDDFREDDPSTGFCKCLQGYYNDGENRVCLQCHDSCLECTNDTACSDCDAADFRELNETENYLGEISDFCVCLFSYYAPDDLTPCSPCHYSCDICDGPNDNDCKVCDETKQRIYQSGLDKCLCDDGYFDDGIKQCSLCDPSCKTCETSSDTCLSCFTDQNRQESGSQCVCSDRFFDDGNAVCPACHYSCLTCSDQLVTSCLTCDSNDHRTQSSGQCLCDDGFYDDGSSQSCQPCEDSCETCDDDLACLTCRSGEFRSLNNTLNELGETSEFCVCDFKYYSPASDQACAACHYSCGICEGPGSNQCRYCYAFAERTLTGSQCLCNDGFFDNGADEQCDPCDDLCATCTGAPPTQCQSCVSGIFYFPSQTTCYTDCPIQYFGNIYNYLCEPCSENCLTCTDSTHCTSCKQNFPLYQDVCLDECPVQSTYQNVDDNICVDCPDHCITCESSLKCLTCELDYFLDELFPLCFPCHQYCKDCFGPASNQCLGCEYPLYLNNSKCHNISCPYGQYVDSIKGCVDCSKTFSNSLTCNISIPFICKQNYKLSNNACVKCDDSKGYKMSNFGKCAQICGDGQLFQLQCDDENNLDGDGCSANCLLEQGWSCSLSVQKKSVCELTGQVTLSLSKYHKFGGKNKLKIDIEVSMPIKLQSTYFSLLVAGSTQNFVWEFSQENSNLRFIYFTIEYSANIQGRQLALTYQDPGSRRLLVTALSLSESFSIDSYPPAQYYSVERITEFETVSNTINILSIILMICCALSFLFPKRMYFNIFTFSYIPAEIFIIFGVACEPITDWVKASLQNSSYSALIYGFNIYECCQVSEFLGYSTKISVNSGVVIICQFVIWAIYGILVLVSRNFCPINPKINMFFRYFIITLQFCVLFHLVYSAINSLYNSSLTEEENPINVCIGIFMTVYLFAFVVWIWVLAYYSEAVQFEEIQEQEKIESKRVSKLRDSGYIFELDNKTMSSGDQSMNQTHKQFYMAESSRSNLQILHHEKSNMNLPQNIKIHKQSPYKAIQQKYLKQWLIYDYVQGIKNTRFSKYFLPLAVTKILIIALIASVVQTNLFVMLIIIGVIHLLFLIFILVVRPFKLNYTTARHVLLEIIWLGLYALMIVYSFQAQLSIYSSSNEYVILILLSVLLALSIVLLVIDVIASWRFEIWNRIEPCLIALRLRSPRQVLDSSQKFQRPDRKNRKVKIYNIDEIEAEEVQKKPTIITKPASAEQKNEKQQQQELDAFFARMLKKEKLKRQYRRERLLKNEKIDIS